MDGVDVHRAQRVNLLIDAHGADFRRHRRADAPGDEHGHHHGGQFLADGKPDHAADDAGQAALGQLGAGLQGHDAADEQGEDAHHEEARVADLEKLVVNFLTLPKDVGQGLHGAPEQYRHFADVLEHSWMSQGAGASAVFFAGPKGT